MKELKNFYILGLPLTVDSINSEFNKFLNSDEPTLLITSVSLSDLTNNDYVTARVGYDCVLKKGYELFIPESRPKVIDKHILHLALWYSEKGRKLPEEVYRDILNLYELSRKEWGDVRIALLVPGSPYLYDDVSSRLMKHIPTTNVIDTKSSAQLIKEIFSDFRFSKYKNLETVIHPELSNAVLKKNAINIIGCIGSAYGQSAANCVNQVTKDNKIFFVRVGYKTKIKSCSVENLLFKLNRGRSTLNSQTMVIISSEDVN